MKKRKSSTVHKTIKRKPKYDEIDEASWESFPCSDPPAWIFQKNNKHKKNKSS